MSGLSDAEAANLKGLESLMEEFFSPGVSNQRKAQIQAMLEEFEQQSSCWSDSLLFLRATSNPYVSMFALTTLEKTIRKRWVGMAPGDKAEVRMQLHDFLVKRHTTVPAYIRNKVAKLLVDIASTDWPHFYPTFFTDITGWIHNSGGGGEITMMIGLTSLLIASEELATPRDNVSSARKDELNKLLQVQVPQILASLSAVLESLLSLFQGGATARLTTTTPPPSPGSLATTDEDSNSCSGPPPLSRLSTTGGLLHVAKDMLGNSASADGSRLIKIDSGVVDVVEVATLALKCLIHLFTWVPLSTVISPRLLAAIFHFAGLGIPCMNASTTGNSSDHSYNTYTKTQLSILAMSTINEIIYRHCVPADFEDFLLQMFQNTFQLLQLLVQPPVDTTTSSPHFQYQLQTLDESYADKFTEFLHSFVQSHLRRFENSHHFPVNEFLSLLFKYTFGQDRSEAYMACLDVWTSFVDFLVGVVESKSAGAEMVKSKYREALTSLVAEVLKKLQFRFNAATLQKMDDETFDDDEETEWQHFLRASIETIVRVSEVLPNEVLSIVDSAWQETSAIYLQLEKAVDHSKPGRLVLPSLAECESLSHLLRDFASILQIIGRLSVLFVGGAFEENLSKSIHIVKQIADIAGFGSSKRLYMMDVQLPAITTGLILAHAQSLATIQAWCQWLFQLHKLSAREKAYEVECKGLTSRIMVSVSAVLKDGSTDPVRTRLLVHSAAHFLVTLTGSVRPPSIWKQKEFTELYSALPQLNLSPEDHRLMVRALTNVLILPWRDIPDQRWDDRQRYLAKFLHDLTTTFRNIKTVPDFAHNKAVQEEAKPVIIHTFQVIQDLAENVRDEGNASKKLCNECIREYTEIAIFLLPIYIHERTICEAAFAYFKTILDVLKSQMGAESVERILHTVVTLFSKDQLTETIRSNLEGGGGSGGGGGGGVVGIRVVERLLEILQLVVKETDHRFRKFIDNALVLCMEHIYPVVAEKSASDIKGALYQVLHNVLLHNWRHFFRSSAIRSLMAEPASPAATQQDQVLHQAQFLAIMRAFGQSFLMQDITVFKQNLMALEEIHSRWKLYKKPVFTQNLTVQFLDVLFQQLVANNHALLREEMTTCVYNMAAVNFDAFFTHFLPNYIDGHSDLDENQKSVLKASFKHDADLPSFINNMSRFISDLRYYKICNASLPAGSVTFSM